MASDDLPIEPPVIPPTPPTPPVIQYESRNILDPQGQTIGTLSFPVGTSENIWTQQLAHYASIHLPFSLEKLSVIPITASGSVTTSSASPATVGGMTKVPEAGTYVAQFSGSIFTAGASAVGEFGIYVNGVLIPETRRDISCNLTLLGGLVTVSLNSIGVGTFTGAQVALDGTQTIDVRFRSTNGGTIGFSDRSFILMKVK